MSFPRPNGLSAILEEDGVFIKGRLTYSTTTHQCFPLDWKLDWFVPIVPHTYNASSGKMNGLHVWGHYDVIRLGFMSGCVGSNLGTQKLFTYLQKNLTLFRRSNNSVGSVNFVIQLGLVFVFWMYYNLIGKRHEILANIIFFRRFTW